MYVFITDFFIEAAILVIDMVKKLRSPLPKHKIMDLCITHQLEYLQDIFTCIPTNLQHRMPSTIISSTKRERTSTRT